LLAPRSTRAPANSRTFSTPTVSRRVPFGLQVNAVQAQDIFVNQPVEAAIAASAEPLPGLAPRPAVAHGDHQIDHESLEELRRRCHHALQKISAQSGFQLLRRSFDPFFRCRSRRARFGRRISSPFLNVARRNMLTEGAKLRETAQELQVDAGRTLIEERQPSRGDLELPATRRLHEPGFGEVELRPMNSVRKNRLLPARQQLRALVA
jgi:hypothetical protein